METPTKGEFSTIVSRLNELYVEDDNIITDKKSVTLLKPVIAKINLLCADIDKLMINYPSCSSDSEQKKITDDLVKAY